LFCIGASLSLFIAPERDGVKEEVPFLDAVCPG
jgi:hypothetical protein